MALKPINGKADFNNDMLDDIPSAASISITVYMLVEAET